MKPGTRSERMEQIARLSPERRALLELTLKERLHRAGDKTSAVRREERSTAPLSSAQQRFWFLDQLEPGPTCHEWTAVRLRGALDRAVLERSINAIVGRHEALRTTIATRDGEPMQTIAPALTIPLHAIDLEPLSEAARWDEAERLAQEETHRLFDLARGPLFRVTLFHMDAEEHVLLLTFHHIVIDAWSATIFYRELGSLYSAFLQEQPSLLPELPIQYADFARWQHEWLRGRACDAQLTYWRERLEGISPLQLPTDRPRSRLQSHRGAQLSIPFSASLVESLTALSREAGASLFMTLLAAFQALLHRYTGQDDIAVGSPVANRNRPEIEGLIGCFTNTLTLRSDCSGNPTFRTLLKNVRTTVLDALTHQDLPFEKLVEELQPERDLDRTPLFQVMLVLNNTAFNVNQFGTMQAEPVDFESTIARFDLTLSIIELEGRLDARLVYNADLFDHASIQRMAGHFHSMLAGVVADPDRRIADLPLLSAAERRQLLVEWNATEADYPRDQCIHQLFEEQVAKTPDAVALVFEDRRLDYAGLNRQANQLAHYLRALGVRPDARVAICLERSLDMVIGLLAILKAGGAYVPLDPALPVERLRFMLTDSAPVALLTHGHLRRLFEESATEGSVTRLPVVDISDVSCCQGEPTNNPDRAAGGLTPEHLAYVMYTSGSTGQPKGVMVEHRSITNGLAWMQGVCRLTDADTVLQKTPFGFDVSVWEIFWPMLAGARLVMARPKAHGDPDHICEVARLNRVTTMYFVPSMLQVFLEQANDADISTLSRVVCSGDALSGSLARRFYERLPNATLYNLYGPTETAVHVTWWKCPVDTAQPVVSIGHPMANVRAYVLDGRREPVPVGVAGELYIGGVAVARGYLNRPDLTTERFGRDLFGTEAGGRMYRTGDLCRWRADGALEFLGRNDFQVKIRGFRIELGEIEARLAEHEGVREAVVIAREDTPGDKRLVAYYTCKETSGGSVASGAEHLSAHVAAKLPDYMVPAAYVRLDAVPLTPHGKVDRGALPAPVGARRSPADDFAPPRTPTEQRVAAIWREVLGLERVGLHDDFFALGGHSLLATQIVSRCRHTFDVEIALLSLFEERTVGGLATRIEQIALQPNRSEPKAAPIHPVSRSEPLPLSFGQERLWFLEQLGSGATYTILAALHIQGPLDIPALEQTLTEVVRRHESLRTTFTQVEGQARQVIHPPTRVGLSLIDVHAQSSEERTATVRRLTREETLRPFNLSTDLLIRATLLRLSTSDSTAPRLVQEHVLLLALHHIASDGWSMGVLARETAVLYEAFSQGRPSPLSELPVQYADFAVWQRDSLRGEVLERHLAYWRTALAGAPELLPLPTDYARPPVQTCVASKLDFQIDAPLTQRFRELCHQSGTTLFMTLLAAFQALLARYSGQDDIVVHSPVANRTETTIEPLIGFFVNDIVLRADLSGNPTFLAFLEQVRQATQAAYEHQGVPFERVVEALQPQRHLGYHPVAQVSFALQNAPMADFTLPGLDVRPLDLEVQQTRMDLEVHLWERGSGLAGSVIYGTDLFAAATIERMIGHFERLLAGIVADPERRISDLPLLSEGERRQLLFEWNATETNALNDSCLHRLFEAQVDRTPDANAVVFGDQRVTYRELNARANQLAHYLQAQGVGPETLVGLCVERSLEMVVGMLGILKAGGAYVPLDPAYPAERTALILQEMQAPVLLSQERLLADLPDHDGDVIALDSRWVEIATYPTANPTSQVGLHNAAYVIYTSGSTGRPKGVLVEHESVAAHCAQYVRFYSLTPADRVLQLASFHFDASVEQIFPALLAGASVILPEWDLDPITFSTRLERSGVTILDLAGAYLRLLLQAWAETPSLIAGSSLRIVIVGADVMPVNVIRLWRQAPLHGKARLFNVYGPTETTVAATVFEVTDAFEDSEARVPIGAPLANKKLYVLDRHRQPVPIGVPGELYIGGVGPARGYLGQPELTREKFIDVGDLPFTTQAHGRVYRSGDRVRWLPDGNIDFLGRIDQQVKIRGFRVELGDIETVLGQHPDVRDTAVLVRADESGQERLVAYLTPRLPDVRIPELRGHLASKLPAYMMPDAFVTLDDFPHTPVGTIDRKALPAPGVIRSAAAYEPPGSATERKIATLWEQLLDRDGLSIHDGFFEIGGHSLLAMEAHSSLRREFPSLRLVDLFSYPTIHSLAGHLTQSLSATSREQASQERGAKRRARHLSRRARAGYTS